MKNPQLSIIVPVYNKEKYILRCLNSIVCWGEDQTEVILVDDGSPDACGEICDTYAERYPWFRVVHQNNAGVSAARNVGIHLAKGEWVSFVDADDELDSEAKQFVLNDIMESKYDVLLYSFKKIAKGRLLEVKRPNLELFGKENVKMVESMLSIGYCKNDEIPPASCIGLGGPPAKFYRKSFLEEHHINFPTDLARNEDVLFSYKVYCNAKAIKLDERNAYIVHEDENGIMSGMPFDKTIDNLQLFMEHLQNYKKEINIPVKGQCYGVFYFNYYLHAIYKGYCSVKDRKFSIFQFHKEMKLINQEKWVDEMRRHIPIKMLPAGKRVAAVLSLLHLYYLVGLEMDTYNHLRGHAIK